VPDERPKLLVVEDDPGLQKQIRWAFDHFQVLQARARTEALALLRRERPAVVLQDLGLPPDHSGVSEGFETLRQILIAEPRTRVIVITGNADRDNAVRAIGLGAYDFCQKPIELDVLRLIVQRALHVYSLETKYLALREAPGRTHLPAIVASDEPMLRVCRRVEKVAPTNAGVLILGESGTGKELIARAVHALSPRSSGRFVAINCAAIPETLLESELFGYEKGAFTGAVKTTQGKIELADGGSLFLDEIGDMPVALQSKMLRFLQERVIERIGGRSEISVDVRVICATHQNLTALMAENRFREDLYYRIAEVTIELPALRDRPGAAVVIAHEFLRRCGAQHGTPRRGFTSDALEALESHPWPGNVRELENRVKTAVIMAEGPLVSALDLGLANGAAEERPLNLREVRARAERTAILQALARSDDNVSRAAELLGVSRPTLYDLMERYGVRRANESSS
jgi:two-component system NtrC family response regulator